LLSLQYGHLVALAGVALHTVNQIVAAVPAVPAPVKNRAAPTCLKSNDEGDDVVPVAVAEVLAASAAPAQAQ